MSDIDIRHQTPSHLTDLPDGVTIEDAEEVAQLANEDRRPSTRRVYESKWGLFEAFCEGGNVDPLPASEEIVGVYLKERAKDVAAIRWMH